MWKLTEPIFVYIFVSTVKIVVSTLVEVFVGTLWCVSHRKSSTIMGISMDIFVYTPVCIFVSTFVWGPKTHSKSRNTKKKKRCIYTNFFEKFARAFALFPVMRVRNPMEIVQKTCSDELCYFGWIFSGGFCFWIRERDHGPNFAVCVLCACLFLADFSQFLANFSGF